MIEASIDHLKSSSSSSGSGACSTSFHYEANVSICY